MPVDHPNSADNPDEPQQHAPLDDRESQGADLPLPLDSAESASVNHANRAQVKRIYAAYRESADADTQGPSANADRSAEADVNADGDGRADRDGWAGALPSLRAAWEEHQERYPARERAAPVTHPDGSWSSGETRTLTPEQNAEAAKACADIHDEGERVMLPAMRGIEAADPSRSLAGLQHMLKGVDRLKEKIAERLRYNPDFSPSRAAADVADGVRFTLEYSETHYADGVVADVERLEGAGYKLLKLKNLWAKDQYKGVNSQWLRPETGLRFEVQFHTPQSREAKELTHKAYERLRDPLTSRAEEIELEAYQRRVNASVKRPPDVFRIEDYPPEKRDV